MFQAINFGDITIGQIILNISISVIIGVGTAIGTAFILKYLSDRLADKLKINWQNSADKLKMDWQKDAEKELREIQKEIDQEHQIFKDVMQSHSANHQFSQSERIAAIKVLWDSVIEVREISQTPQFFYDIFLKKEYNSVFNDKSNSKAMLSYIDKISEEKVSEKLIEIRPKVEKFRPFLGEKLWNLFIIYTILNARVVMSLRKGIDNKNIESWHEDKPLKTTLTYVFDTKEIETIYSLEIDSLRLTKELFESKILSEASRIISGEYAGERSLAEVKNILEARVKTNENKIVNK